MEKTVLFEIDNKIALITLNRPHRRNAINRDLLINLYDCLDEVTKNDNINVAIITGKGKSFCSGLDLDIVTKENLFNPREDGSDLPDIIAKCNKPIIGAVNGHAITGGFEIALNCDFLIASEKASFADTHAKVGIHPGWGMTQLLQQAVGQRRAKQMSYTCTFISADQALKWGLVNEVVPEEKLIERAKQIASEICNVNQDMLHTVAKLIKFQNTTNLNESYKHERSDFRAFVKKHLVT